jgi:hypothetical protein
MAWNTAICQTCCTPPKVALNASEVFRNTRDLSQYVYTSTIQGQTGKPYQFKSQTERLQTLMGRVNNPQAIAFRRDGGVGCQCANVGSVTGIVQTGFDFVDPNYIISIAWNATPGAISYSVTTNYPNSSVVVSGTTATITSPDFFNDFNATVTAVNSCSSSSASEILFGPCFLAGSLVAMGDGSTKAIEDVQVGDVVLGAFGELNEVLALHRPLLGENKMTKINEEHSTTSHHPHISIDKKFYSNNPTTTTEATYGRHHNVIDADGSVVSMFLHGLKKERILQLQGGIELKTTDGSRVVRHLEMYSLPPETQLYNLVVGGSHTYHVDGYAVTGWPREDDFDYDAWKPISSTN